VERFNLRKLNELDVNKNCHSKISNRFAVLEDLNYWQGHKEALGIHYRTYQNLN
jgi:hypothetical protein